MRFAIRGQNVPFFRKRVLLDSTKGRLGVIFQIPPNIFSKKACLGVNLGENHAKFSIKGCFSWRGEIMIRVCFKNLWSCMCTTLVFKWPPFLCCEVMYRILQAHYLAFTHCKICTSWVSRVYLICLCSKSLVELCCKFMCRVLLALDSPAKS